MTFSSSPPLKRRRFFEESAFVPFIYECRWKWGSFRPLHFRFLNSTAETQSDAAPLILLLNRIIRLRSVKCQSETSSMSIKENL